MKKTVAVLGLWHLGLVHTAGLAKLGFKVIALDPDESLINDLRHGTVRLFEPGMTEILNKHRKNKTIEFTTDFSKVAKADAFFMAYDTPLTPDDDVDLTSLFDGLKNTAPFLKANCPFIVASQIPVGTCDLFEEEIQKINNKWKSGVVCMPENLRLGQAMNRFLKPDFLVFGTNKPAAAKTAAKFFDKIKTEKRFTSSKNAEMVKHAINMHLAVSITYINQLAQVAEALGADAIEVSNIIRLDPRIGKAAPLFPGLGFSGGTLARDVRLLLQKSKEHNLNAPLLKAIGEINDSTFEQVVKKLSDHLGNLKSKKVAILGITYKPNTSTLRRSPAIRLAEMLKKSDVQCFAFDPKADVEETNAHKHLFSRKNSIADALDDVDGVIVVTEWPEFKKMNLNKLGAGMKTKLLIDTKNFLDPLKITKAGFTYEGFGRRN